MRISQITTLFNSIDQKNIAVFSGFLAENVVFRFGNAEAVQGKSSVSEAVDGFLHSIKAIKHDLTDIWQQPDAVLCQGKVTYTRVDDSILQVPFANVLKYDDGKITDYLIYIDNSRLFQPD